MFRMISPALLILAVAGCALSPNRAKYDSDYLENAEVEYGRQITMMVERIADTKEANSKIRTVLSKMDGGKDWLSQVDRHLHLTDKSMNHIDALAEFIRLLERREFHLKEEEKQLMRFMTSDPEHPQQTSGGDSLKLAPQK